MKQLFPLILFCLMTGIVTAQNYNAENSGWTKYVVRMYKASPFEGVRIVKDAERCHLVSVVSLDPSKYGNNTSTISRVALIKAQSQVNTFLNQPQISTEIIVNINESDGNTDMTESIKMKANGHVDGLELVGTINENGKNVFIYSSEIK